MAIYHLNFSNGKVGKGLAHFEYINSLGKYDYKENELVYSKNFLPQGMKDACDFWITADISERINGRVYKEIRLALPHEFSKEENIKLLEKFLEKEIGNKFYYSAVIHDKENQSGTKQNIHCHIMICPRELDGIDRPLKQFFSRYNSKNPALGGARKSEYWNKKETLLHFRESWAETLNEELEKHNLEKVSHKTLEAQRNEALEKGNLILAKTLDREPVAIEDSYLLRKNEKDLNEDESIKLNIYNETKKLKKLYVELETLLKERENFILQKEKNQKEYKELFEKNKDYALNIKFENNEEYLNIYNLQKDILMLEVDKKHLENQGDSLHNAMSINAINQQLKHLNNVLSNELEKIKDNQMFEKIYGNGSIKALIFKNDVKEYNKNLKLINLHEKNISHYKNQLAKIDRVALNVISKNEYSTLINRLRFIDRKIKNEKDTPSERIKERERLINLIDKLKNKYLTDKKYKFKFETIKKELITKYEKLINDKEKEYEKSIIKNLLIMERMKIRSDEYCYESVIKDARNRKEYFENKLKQNNLKIDNLKNFNIKTHIFNKISNNDYEKLMDKLKATNQKITKLNKDINQVSTFSIFAKKQLLKELTNEEEAKKDIALKLDKIIKSIPHEEYEKLYMKYFDKKQSTINKLDTFSKTYINEILACENTIKITSKARSNIAFNNRKHKVTGRTPNLNDFAKSHSANLGNIENGISANLLDKISDDDKLAIRMRRELDFSR